VPPPAGFRGGVAAVAGGTFVPASPHLGAVPGYVVPAPFWAYLTDPRAAPGGWLRDIGPPLTPAIPATVNKGPLGTRHVLVQAFQCAVLTYDAANPARYRVERANIGLDYAAASPRAVR
jgi:hypothetical protein